MTKPEMRDEMRTRLRALGDSRAQRSQAIAEAIVAHPNFAAARTVALFDALPFEPDLSWLWLHRGTRCFYYPRVKAQNLAFFEVKSADELEVADWNPRLREPRFEDSRMIHPEALDLVLVPGVAFTRQGQRLGQGGGFYDRLLAILPARTAKLGICFATQLVADLPLEAHDCEVDAVITEPW